MWSTALSLDCVFTDIDFYSTFMCTIIYPVILLALIVLVTMVRVAGADAKESAAMYTQAWKISLLGAFLVHAMPHMRCHTCDATPAMSHCSYGGHSSQCCRCIPVSQRPFSRCGTAGDFFVLFADDYNDADSTTSSHVLIDIVLISWACRDIEGISYLRVDYRIKCEDEWNAYAGIAAIAFFVYPVGIPATYLYLLRRNKAALHDKEHPDHSDVEARLGFIYRQYEPDGEGEGEGEVSPVFVYVLLQPNDFVLRQL